MSASEGLPPEHPGAPERTPSRGYLFAGKRPQPVNTVRWYHRIFQGAPDLIRELLQGSAAATNALGLDPAATSGEAGSPGGLAGVERLIRHAQFAMPDLQLRRGRYDLWPWSPELIECG